MLYAQFQTLESAREIDKYKFRLTKTVPSNKGAVWCEHQLDLTKDFDIMFDLFLGCNEPQADGIAFVLQQDGLKAMGEGSSGMAYRSIMPSLAVEFDNYTNDFESYFPMKHTHIAITTNGDTQHHTANNLAGPELASPEKAVGLAFCDHYEVQIIWKKETKDLLVFVDNMSVVSYRGDIIQTVFNGNSKVFWGFTGATSRKRYYTQGIKLTPLPLRAEIEANAPSCFDGNDGNIKVQAFGGIKSYSYRWSTGQTTQEINNLTAGNYQVTVTDGMGVSAAQAILLKSKNPLDIVDMKKNSDADFDWSAEATGGTPPYTWRKGYAFLETENRMNVDAKNLQVPTHENVKFIYEDKGTVNRKMILYAAGEKAVAEIGFMMVTDAKGCKFRRYLPFATTMHRPKEEAKEDTTAIIADVVEKEPLNVEIAEKEEETNLEKLELTYTTRNLPDKLGDRNVKKPRDIFLKEEKIEVSVWDDETVDGDTISIYFNGEWLLKDYALKRKKKTIKLNVSRNADNYLILYAKNEGLRPPNTAAVLIKDGKKARRVALSSDLENCDAINFRFRE